jgi:hypothetical protein
VQEVADKMARTIAEAGTVDLRQLEDAAAEIGISEL